jgi:nicotinic acid phosphoribosyltransferase
VDTYDQAAALSDILPAVAAKQLSAGGVLILRPDSGDARATTVEALRACARVFGADTNAKGYAVLRRAGVLQGDSMDAGRIRDVLEAVQAAGFSAQCVAFGIGGALLQKVHRDTMSFATKLCHVGYADGSARDCMKTPKTDLGKSSLPGILQVRRGADGVARAYPVPDAGAGAPMVAPEDNLLQVVYDKRPVAPPPPPAAEPQGRGDGGGGFDALRRRVAAQWAAAPARGDPISPPLRALMTEVARKREKDAARDAARDVV